jgi:hypothetical protein
MPCKCKSSQSTYSRNSSDPNTRAFYNKYCKILNNVTKEAKKQHYSGLITKSDNNNYRNIELRLKGDRKSTFREHMPRVLKDYGKVQYPATVDNALNKCF